MFRLNSRFDSKWEGDPFVAQITRNSNSPVALRYREALIVDEMMSTPASGFRAYLRARADAPVPLDCNAPILELPQELNYLGSGDIVKINPRDGRIRVIYRINGQTNFLLATERCNSKCLMCSQPPRDIDDSYLIDDYMEAIPLMSRDTRSLGITGGEPTLLGDNLLRLLRTCKSYLPNTHLHMLSNGRLFSYLSLCQEVNEIQHPDFMIAVPLYSDIASLHDYVVQAEGAFDETIRGLMNLARFGQRIELRIVLHKLTVERLPQFAEFVARNLPFVDHVSLMGLELMGYTKMNMEALWIDPVDYQDALGDAVRILVRGNVTPIIFNHQLCVLDRPLWAYNAKSISDWKNEYIDACNQCSVKRDCGGFFASGVAKHSRAIRPIPEKEFASVV